MAKPIRRIDRTGRKELAVRDGPLMLDFGAGPIFSIASFIDGLTFAICAFGAQCDLPERIVETNAIVEVFRKAGVIRHKIHRKHFSHGHGFRKTTTKRSL